MEEPYDRQGNCPNSVVTESRAQHRRSQCCRLQERTGTSDTPALAVISPRSQSMRMSSAWKLSASVTSWTHSWHQGRYEVTVHGPSAARDRPGGAWAQGRPRCLPSTSPAATAPRDSAKLGFLVLGGRGGGVWADRDPDGRRVLELVERRGIRFTSSADRRRNRRCANGTIRNCRCVAGYRTDSPVVGSVLLPTGAPMTVPGVTNSASSGSVSPRSIPRPRTHGHPDHRDLRGAGCRVGDQGDEANGLR